jgi:hypothetical protein
MSRVPCRIQGQRDPHGGHKLAGVMVARRLSNIPWAVTA